MPTGYKRVGAASRNVRRMSEQKNEHRPHIIRDQWRERFPRKVKDKQPSTDRGEQVTGNV